MKTLSRKISLFLVGFVMIFAVALNLDATPTTTQEQTSIATVYAHSKTDDALKKINELIPVTYIVTEDNQNEFISIFKKVFKEMDFDNYAVAGHQCGKNRFHVIVIVNFPEIDLTIRLDGVYRWEDPIKI